MAIYGQKENATRSNFSSSAICWLNQNLLIKTKQIIYEIAKQLEYSSMFTNTISL